MEYVEPIHTTSSSLSSSSSKCSCCNNGYALTRAGLLRIGIIVKRIFIANIYEIIKIRIFSS